MKTQATKTLKDLAVYIEDCENENAPGSETNILGAFVYKYDYTNNIIDNNDTTPITDDEWDFWASEYSNI